MGEPQISPQALARQTAAAKYGEHVAEQTIAPLIKEKIDIYRVIDAEASSEIVIRANVIGALMLDLIISACASSVAGHESDVLNELKEGIDKAWEQRAAVSLDYVRKHRERYNARS